MPSINRVCDIIATYMILGLVSALAIYITVKMVEGAKRELARKKANPRNATAHRKENAMRQMLHKFLLAALPVVFLAGCVDYGKVDQGRTVAVDKDKKTVTIIRDKANDTNKPDYNYLPALTYSFPPVSAEMGPEPKAGLRMKLDADKPRSCSTIPRRRAS